MNNFKMKSFKTKSNHVEGKLKNIIFLMSLKTENMKTSHYGKRKIYYWIEASFYCLKNLELKNLDKIIKYVR
jgi:hypothetical protein